MSRNSEELATPPSVYHEEFVLASINSFTKHASQSESSTISADQNAHGKWKEIKHSIETKNTFQTIRNYQSRSPNVNQKK